MRPILYTLATLSLAAALGLIAFARAAEPASQNADSTDLWVGEYLKYARYDTKRQGQFGEAQRLKITRDGDGYYLSGYEKGDGHKFTEIEKGILSTEKGGLGSIILGQAQFADGKRIPVLRAEFCYEQFILYGETR